MHERNGNDHDRDMLNICGQEGDHSGDHTNLDHDNEHKRHRARSDPDHADDRTLL